tara:strand:- start:208 stop:633 length:426 start_codon:yes stop_codon:yes gene_type:complete
MATRSRIGLQLADGHILSVYHHWDGYPQWLGVTLNNKFNTREKVAELIDGGDISCCDSDSDWNLNKVENHVQYYNDRGDNTEPRLDSNFDDYVKDGEEYAYVFTLDHVWECYAIDRNYDDDYNVIGVNVKVATIPTEEAVA